MDNDGGDPTVYGDAAPYVAASTAKIITAAAYYHLAETGEKSLDVPLGSFDAAFQLKAMVNNGSDDSWLLTSRRVPSAGPCSANEGVRQVTGREDARAASCVPRPTPLT